MYIYIYIYVDIRMYVDMHIYIHININIYLFVTIVERGKFVARYECKDCNMSVHLVLTTDSPGISVSTYINLELSANKYAYIIYTCMYNYMYTQMYTYKRRYLNEHIYMYKSNVRIYICRYIYIQIYIPVSTYIYFEVSGMTSAIAWKGRNPFFC
jgi:hypothetical protein